MKYKYLGPRAFFIKEGDNVKQYNKGDILEIYNFEKYEKVGLKPSDFADINCRPELKLLKEKIDKKEEELKKLKETYEELAPKKKPKPKSIPKNLIKEVDK